jgi:hypothetical protein
MGESFCFTRMFTKPRFCLRCRAVTESLPEKCFKRIKKPVEGGR